MERTTIDLWFGAFVLAGFAALLVLALKVGNLGADNARTTYRVEARFDNIGGLKVRAPVRSSGVLVGRVADINFDNERFQAGVTLALDKRYGFPKDTSASILTSGLLGETYVGLDAGGDDKRLADGDRIADGNRNRQLPALAATLGQGKAEAMAARLRAVNPGLQVEPIAEFLRDDRLREVLAAQPYGHVVDAIDSLSPKVFLIALCRELGLPVVSAMGAGGKLDPTQVRVADLDHSHHCPLARMVRKRLHRLGIRQGVEVVFSPEPVQGGILRLADDEGRGRSVLGSVPTVPAAFGAACAAVVLRRLAAVPPLPKA